MTDWREQEATNQTIFRDMNEWTEEANEDVRSLPTRFAIALNHENPEMIL
jgi:hypothetical protein